MSMWAAILLAVSLQGASGFGGPADAIPEGRVHSGVNTGVNEILLIAGDVRMELLAADPGAVERFERRRFEITVRSRQGQTVHAEACIFAGMMDDSDWNGTCFLLPVRAFDRQQAALLNAADVVPNDPVAQKLLRTLMVEANPLLRPARRLVGFYPGLALQVTSDRYPEVDL